MTTVNLAEAKAHLSALVDRASKGEEIEILRHGKLVARLLPPAGRASQPFDWKALKAFTDSMPMQSENAADLIRRMRDDGY
ncbi:type II toxin-antitoxin system Phd/YefM family antitoxin [Brevundimonas sp.]|uniref:type II toxin-antitoxin system Phd/YefM family antitoxin n=1 Tax=Brevundimonas sp. TaxID=1871086 RepID=UPI003565981B